MGFCGKADTAKEEHKIEGYREEINLIIAEEVTERKTEVKTEPMIQSLDTKIKEQKKEWVKNTYQYDENGITKENPEENKYLLIETKEGYEFIIEVDNERKTAQIISENRTQGEKYTITYHPNGGIGEEKTVEVRSGFSTVLEENTYIREDYIFDGWYEKEELEEGAVAYLVGSSYTPRKDVTLYAIWKEKPSIESSIKDQTVFEENTILLDKYKNQVTVPKGFKIAQDSGTDVTKGIVIEDVSADTEITKGSQFVWIPVGKVNNENGSKTIELSRYTFGTTNGGIPEKQGDNVINSYYQELAESNYGNTTAKDIEGFKTSATTNHGYYMGRYEAGDPTATAERIATSGNTNPMVCKKQQFVYNYVTQQQAATLARGMYENKSFISDLMNSYARDTALVYIYEFSGRFNYINATTGNATICKLRKTGELNDVVCNIHDLSGNCFEWSTETYVLSDFSTVQMGGAYPYEHFRTSTRRHTKTTGRAEASNSFRAILYL